MATAYRIPRTGCPAGLLLLLLLIVFALRLLVVFDEQRPFLVGREVLVGREQRLRGGDADPHLELGLGAPLHGAERRRDVRVVAAYRGPDVAGAGHSVL